MKIKTRLLALVMAVLMCTSGIAFAESNFPLVSGPTTLKIWGSMSSIQPEFSDMYILQEYEKMTGVTIEWTNIPSSAKNEKMTLAISSGELPDVFFKFGISANNLQIYGDSGDFIDLAPLLETYAPNFMAYATANPDVLASITSPDGKIYSLPAIGDAPASRMAKKLYFNQEWMDKLGLEQPTTLDELTAVLTAMRENDPNGNGEKDEVPLTEAASNLYRIFGGLFNCFNRGEQHAEYDVDPETGLVRHTKTSDAFRQTLEYMHKLYEEGIIDQECITFQDSVAVGYDVQDRLGVYFATNLALLSADKMEKWTPASTYVEGAIWPMMRSQLRSVGAFVITAACEDPGLALRWVDYFYSDEGVAFYHYGIENDTYVKNEDGSLSYVNDIMAQVSGDKSYDEVVSQYSPYCGGNNPTIMSYPGYAGMEMSAIPVASANTLVNYLPEVIWPIMTHTSEETEVLSTIGSDLDNYVAQTCAEFLTGERELNDAEWGAYVQRTKDMGVDKVIEVYTATIARMGLK